MGVLITVRSGKREVLKDFFANCSQMLSIQLKAMMYFPFLGEGDQIGDYLKKNGLSLKERLRIQSSFARKKKVRLIKSEILVMIEEWQKEKALSTPEDRQKWLGRVRRLKHKYYRNLLTFVLAIKAKNLPWAVSLKRELIKSSPYWNLVGGIRLSKEEEEKLRDFHLFSLELYEDFHEDSEGLKMLAEKFTQTGHTNEFKAIRSRNGADWSLTDLRSQFKNPLLKTEYFDFWYMMMMNRTSDAELREKFRQTLSIRSLKKAKEGQLWVFEFFFPPQNSLRDVLLGKMIRMWSSQEISDRYTVLRCLDSENIKASLSKKSDQFKRANFQLKRDVFTSILGTGFSTESALYKLYLLGDKNEENLWWLML